MCVPPSDAYDNAHLFSVMSECSVIIRALFSADCLHFRANTRVAFVVALLSMVD